MEPRFLREQSLRDARLAAASLAGADLRGTNFTGADLHDADLSRIRSGMSRRWTAVVVAGSLACSIAIGLVAGVCTHYLRTLYADDRVRLRAAAWAITAMLLAFLIVGIARGIRFASRTILPVTAAIAAVVALAAIVTGLGTGRGALLAVVFVGFVVLVIAMAVLVRAVAGTAGALWFTVVAVAGGLAGGAAGGGIASTAIAAGAMLMARRSAKLEADYPLLEKAIAAIASRGGTRFRNANLAGASFADARLVACDFRGADLTGARFERATMRACRRDRATALS